MIIDNKKLSLKFHNTQVNRHQVKNNSNMKLND